MRITNAKLIKTVYEAKDLPPLDKKEIAFAGRSNVGKSSFLNTVLGLNAAKVSSSPGKTRSINYYLVNDIYYFVDLPGYGFAKVSKQEKERWSILLEAYFNQRLNLNMVFLLLDHRHLPQDLDYVMIEWLRDLGIPFIIILTKVDKLKTYERKRMLEQIKKSLSVYGDYIYIPFSSKTKEELKEVLDLFSKIFGESSYNSDIVN